MVWQLRKGPMEFFTCLITEVLKVWYQLSIDLGTMDSFTCYSGGLEGLVPAKHLLGYHKLLYLSITEVLKVWYQLSINLDTMNSFTCLYRRSWRSGTSSAWTWAPWTPLPVYNGGLEGLVPAQHRLGHHWLRHHYSQLRTRDLVLQCYKNKPGTGKFPDAASFIFLTIIQCTAHRVYYSINSHVLQ